MKKRLLATIPVLLVVFLCSSFSVFANQVNGSANTYFKTYELYNGNHGTVKSHVWLTSMGYEEDSYESPSGIVNGDFTYVVKVRVAIENNCDTDIRFPNTVFRVDIAPYNQYPANGYFRMIDYQFDYGSIYPAYVNANNIGRFNFVQTSNSNHSSLISVPQGQTVDCYFTIYYKYNSYAAVTAVNPPAFNDTSVSFSFPSTPVAFEFGTFASDNYAYIRLLYLKFLEFLDSYNSNVPQSTNVTNESSALETTSDNVHTQESSYYTQTNTALGNTGLSNFSFSPNVIGGLGKAKDQFTYVWNKLGDYKDVYLFSMTLAIALMIIRHVRPIRRKKEE